MIFGHHNFSYDFVWRPLHVMHLSRSCWVSSDTRQCWWLEASKVGTPTRPPWGLPCQTPCSYARRSGCFYTSFDRDHDSVFLLFFEHQTSHAACFNAQGLLYECVFDALLFSSSYRLVGKPVSHHVFTRPTFSSLLFWTIIPAILPAMMLGYYSWVHLRLPLNFFIIVSIYWKPASYRSSLNLSSFGKTTNRSAAKSICSFLFWTDVNAIWPVDSSTTSSWPF
jgi:hypothetical protein